MLVAVLAMSAVAAASASAAAPEFKFGVNGKFPNPSYGESGAVTLATKVENKKEKLLRQVTCKASKTTEEMGGFTEFKKVLVKLTGCKAEGPLFTTSTCKSASGGSEEIIANTLTAKLRYIDEATDEVGLVFAPETGTTFASFTCTDLGQEQHLTVKGSVIGRITPVRTFAKTFKIEFAQAKGVQKPTAYEEGGKKVTAFLEMEGSGALETFAFEPSGLQAADSLVWTEAVEVT
jgi:hypothetical protein